MPTKITDTKGANLSPEQPTGRNMEEKPLMNNQGPPSPHTPRQKTVGGWRWTTPMVPLPEMHLDKSGEGREDFWGWG